MSYIIYGMGNEVLYFWGTVFAMILILLLSFPYFNRVSQSRYEEQLRNLRANYIGRINTHATSSSSSVHRMEAINRRARTEASRTVSTLPQSSVRSDSSRSVETCPICLENVQLGVAPLCNHLLCGRCVFQFFELSETNGPYRCPMCRTEITMITARFTRGERQAPTDCNLGELRAVVIDSIMEYNQNYLTENLTIWDQIVELPRLINHFVGEVFSPREGMIPLSIRIRFGGLLIVTLIYCLFPYDVFSEAQHGLYGFVDDLGILVCAIIYINYSYRRLVTHADYFRLSRN